jgi:triosephosphate isomerase
MIKSIGCEYVIIGHSERRTIFNESDDEIRSKIKQAKRAGLIPIVMYGEQRIKYF